RRGNPNHSAVARCRGKGRSAACAWCLVLIPPLPFLVVGVENAAGGEGGGRRPLGRRGAGASGRGELSDVVPNHHRSQVPRPVPRGREGGRREGGSEGGRKGGREGGK
ncbi:hypothetical protein Naga_103969g1, partial [Nannochloropsis gaditana]